MCREGGKQIVELVYCRNLGTGLLRSSGKYRTFSKGILCERIYYGKEVAAKRGVRDNFAFEIQHHQENSGVINRLANCISEA
jgi:hypothetical protein